ncbi:anaerobic ribonucleoside-triphosphate reductase activating protein [Diaphorobacter ruginosibacter]|uniref:anaerobic ribonucleoside-triphosphate reductase activating protein n=1 Tax=Diaphorobacter ruginosibacter TaxID=1715720 RepID=UPI00333E5E30
MGGITPFTSIDFPGKLSAVLYVQGCPWRCGYCHNPHLQQRGTPVHMHWDDTLQWLRKRVGLIDAVVFSGGEPTTDPMLEPAMRDVRGLGLAVGLHSAGTHPRHFGQVLPLADWVGLDVKAPLCDPDAYARLTGIAGSAESTAACLRSLIASGVAYETRTTAHAHWLDDGALLRLAQDLRARGVTHHVLQIARSTDTCQAPAMPDYPAAATLDALQALFPSFTVRRE